MESSTQWELVEVTERSGSHFPSGLQEGKPTPPEGVSEALGSSGGGENPLVHLDTNKR
jgi:hypothetical protein